VAGELGDGPDAALARQLHRDGLLPLETLQGLVAEARALRAGDPAASLAGLAVQRGLLTAAALEAAAGRARAPPATRLGPHRLVRELGRGGMGIVHEAVHEETGARCAVKTLVVAVAGDPAAVGGLWERVVEEGVLAPWRAVAATRRRLARPAEQDVQAWLQAALGAEEPPAPFPG